MEHSCLKTEKGGPYIFKVLPNQMWSPISLRGPFMMTDCMTHTEEECIKILKEKVSKSELKTFSTWQEMLEWAMDEPYLKR